jgi:hypothetical protein
MDYSTLEKNIIDILKEEQVKLGYRKEAVRLYYPLKSLNSFLNAELDTVGMCEALKGFCAYTKDKLGSVEFSNEGDRFCIILPEEASEYVYENTEKTGFIYDFIDTVSRHGVTMDEVIMQFKKYSDCVHVEKVSHGEFDYLVYFEDGKPDDFKYCLTDEGCHIIYHRFTEADYKDFHFE